MDFELDDIIIILIYVLRTTCAWEWQESCGQDDRRRRHHTIIMILFVGYDRDDSNRIIWTAAKTQTETIRGYNGDDIIY